MDKLQREKGSSYILYILATPSAACKKEHQANTALNPFNLSF